MSLLFIGDAVKARARAWPVKTTLTLLCARPAHPSDPEYRFTTRNTRDATFSVASCSSAWVLRYCSFNGMAAVAASSTVRRNVTKGMCAVQTRWKRYRIFEYIILHYKFVCVYYYVSVWVGRVVLRVSEVGE